MNTVPLELYETMHQRQVWLMRSHAAYWLPAVHLARAVPQQEARNPLTDRLISAKKKDIAGAFIDLLWCCRLVASVPCMLCLHQRDNTGDKLNGYHALIEHVW